MIIAMNIPVDLIIMTNDGNQGDKVLEMHGVKKSAYKFWVNGVEKLSPDIYIEDKAKKEYLDKKIIFMACQLVEEKGVHLMIEAMPDIIKKHKDVVLIVAGTGNQKVKLEKSAKYLGISNHIDFLGAVEWDKLKTYYKLAHIFVSLYRYSNMGNPTLEAMAWGKCIVTLNHFDTNKFIFNNETGMLLNDIQIQDLSNIISDLLVDERKLRRLGFKAKEFARNNLWEWDKRVSAEIYEIERLIREYQKCKN